jgi:DNA-directed RNA polymerase specialized sigma24 family protein
MSRPASAPPEAFDALLDALATEPDGAARAYERLRERLVALLRVYVPAEADALADVVLDRLARRIAEGVAIDDLRAYALGIARLVVKEARARDRRRHEAEADPTFAATEPDDDRDALDAAVAALRACLAQLDAASRTLILAYYGDDGGGVRIRARQRLAAQLGSTLNALRNRALRLRSRLEDCLKRRLGGRSDA